MFQPNVAPWQQQHHQQQTQSPHQQQQPQQQQLQPQYQQQNNTDAKWNQPGLSAPSEQQTAFQPFNYNPPINNMNKYVNYEHQQPQQQLNNVANLQTQQEHQQSLTQNFFDNKQNNNNGRTDEWGDWGDWNENNINMENNNQQKLQQQQQQLFHTHSQTQQQEQQQTQSATNIINESFTVSDNNWNWNIGNANNEQPVKNVLSTSSTVLPSPPTMQAQQQQVQRHISNFQQPPAQILDRASESATQFVSQENNAENLNHFAKSGLPPTSATTNNIPNTVFVTQAKPVTMPSRQYASTPSEVSTPTNVEQIIAPPPEGFQNDVPQMATTVPVVSAAISVTAPPVVPLAAPPLTTSMPPLGAAKQTGNPFKRAGATQHHVTNFIPTTQKPIEQTAFLPVQINETNNSYFEPPPAPLVYEQPDNSEVLHENQEVVSQSYAPLPQQQQQQHLNDERNQYLQTSHLSENAGEENVEADSLPPPGLSRLVLGEPELEANQRLVTGTEDTLPDLVGNMRLDERQADGEDNTNDVGTIRTTLTGGNVQASTVAATMDNMQIVADRNLYLVPGQSNGNNDQLPRVLTGFDNAVQIDAPTPTHSMQQQQQNHQQHINIVEQREIELDGENIEDQQQPQQRNEPPVEGAAAQVPQQQQQVAANTALDIKETSQVSAPKEESDLEQQRKHSRKQPIKEHVHEKKHSSVDRFNSDEETDEAEYSSDRERERERNRQRRAYREGSVRSEAERERTRDRAWEREREEHELYQKERRRRDRRERESGEKEKPRDKYRANESTTERRSKRYTRYEHDSSVEESNRKEKSLREKKSLKEYRERDKDRRSDREYDEYNRRYRHSKRGLERDEEVRPRRDREREREYDETERRRRRDKLGNRTVDAERDEYEEYRKQSSRNARDSDIEKERGPRSYDPRHAAMYGYHHGGQVTGAYDPYYYYDYMARYNHPAYNEMIKKYYGAQSIVSTGDVSGVGGTSSTAATGAGSDHLTGDGRESVHSGRSSLQQEHERSGHASMRDADVLPDPQRLTPCKFVNEHTVASLSAGILVTVKPKYTSHGHSCNIVKVQRLGANDVAHKLMQAFPGPLIRGQTHKKTIIEFCEEQIRRGPQHTTIYAKQLVNNDIEKYRPSYTLMWNLLILLLRQNGMVVGTDIAELLLKNKNEFPYEVKQQTVDLVSESEDIVAENEKNEEQTNENDNAQSRESLSQALSESEVTNKFRQYLLYGNVNEALDWATDNNLWGHALFLASKMDRRTHANVMMKFANKLSLNDPLQTLYQLMSGRTPSSVTSVQDEKWGDWRPHLSMILSNTSQKPELDRKAITTLGDSLFNRGDLYAAHFCYLMAQVGFGRYQESATNETTLQNHLPRLVLLGSSHYKSFMDFTTNEAIIMTEIYEYACSLNDEKFSLIEFQPYKYLYATRLLDYGYHLKTLMYMEQIALHIERHPTKYETTFINKVFELADRLKYYDPVVDKTVDDAQGEGIESPVNDSLHEFEEQKWLQNLRTLASRERENNSNLSAAESTVNQQYAPNMIDQQFMDINRQFNELNSQYGAHYDNTETTLQQQQQQIVPQIVETQQQYQQIDSYGNYSINQVQQQQPIVVQQQQTQQNAFYDPTQHQYEQQQQNQQMMGTTEGAAAHNSYDYWAQQQQQQSQAYMPEENARPSITLPKTKSYDTDDDQQQNQQRAAQQQSKGNEASKNQTKQNKNNNKENKSSQSAAQNSGWFGGIWNKLSMKPKNQMILPDDKNPTIVWDAEKKRWVNTDAGDDAAEESFKPPPKMGDIMMPQQQHQQPQQMQTLQQQQPSVVNQIPVAAATPPLMQPTATPAQPAPSKTPTLQSNMFKMQRNRTLKNSYVDVFNPSGAPISNPAENIMAPLLPTTTVPTTGFFNPGESAQQQQNNTPQFYNPNQFGGNNGAGY